MSKFSKIIGLTVLAILTVVPAVSAQRGFGRRVIVRPYSYFGGPAFGFGGYWGPSLYYPGYYPAGVPATGEIKIDTRLKDAFVYVDGGYVGSDSKFKKFWLLPGNHDIELRDSAKQVIFQERVQVIVGKTIEIRSPA